MFIIAQRLFKGRGGNVEFVSDPRIENYCNIVEAILKHYWRILNVILKKSPMFCSIATNILSKENRIAAEERWHWKSGARAGM
jgi:hypothetical protein